MTALIDSIQSVLLTKLPIIVLPEVPPRLDAAYQKLKKLEDKHKIEMLTPQENEYWINLANSKKIDSSWGDLNLREKKKIALCLWHGENYLSKDIELLESFLKSCEQGIKKSLCRVLIWVYLNNYKENSLEVSILGKWISKTISQWDWPWFDRHKNLSLFSGSDAAVSIANMVMNSKENVSDVLDLCGLSGALKSGGMSSLAFSKALMQYQNNIDLYDSGEIILRLRRITEWATLEGEAFSYPKLKTLFIESVLLPWVQRRPEDKIVNLSQGFLVDSFGDPRLGGASWIGVNDDAMRVIRGWLVKRALAQFMDVVDELAIVEQWKYRRAFWMAYYDKGVISDAWVAFANNGATKAKQIAQRNQDNSWLSFGNLYGSGDPDHAVLILRIGNLIIADFSHNGKCRLWNSRNDRAPKVYEKNYDRSDLMHSRADSEYIHHNSSTYLWQGRVASEINNVTGIKLMQKDYTPK